MAKDFYRDRIYPYLVDKWGDPPPIQKIRQTIIPFAQGAVLEIGAGSGANFPYYDHTTVNKLYALEPNAGMIQLAKRKAHQKLKIEFLDLPGEHIPVDNETIDTVVSTFTLCTISGIKEAIQEIVRVLKPGGELIFFELGLSPERNVQRWQKLLEPIVYRLFQGLHLTREIPSLITEGGLTVKQVASGYVAQFPKSLTYCWWGKAVKISSQLTPTRPKATR